DKFKMNVSGYGDMQFAYENYGADERGPYGAQKDSRANFDATRFAVELEGFYLPYNIQFEAEVEFEHGGTGVSREVDYNENGEYDVDVEKGGEVYLEEFFLKKHFTSNFSMSAGRIMVGVGLLSWYNRPTDYLGVQRDEAELHMLPESWNEMGLEA